jgi:hypothetical protein
MDRINMARVAIGGLAAGLVINIGEFLLNGVFLSADMNAAMARLQLPPVSGGAVGIFMVLGFLLGIAIVWLYAAMRPRFGAGSTTALYAGGMAWALAYVYPSIGMAVMGLFPSRLIVIGLVWGAVELSAAALAGGWLYREEPSRTRMAT